MASWRVDEGLQKLIDEWKAAHPGAVVYTIGDTNHSTDPDKSQHAPDDGSSSNPGDTKGEVDAGDFMPGKAVTDEDLDDLAENLRLSKDKRILYVIRRNRIFSSVVQPWVWRTYTGAYHSHTHVSVNDNYENDQSNWKWENDVARTIVYKDIPGAKLPELAYGDEDAAQDGWNHVGRAQGLLNFQEKKEPLDIDGVYGAKTKAKVARVFGTNGKTLSIDLMKKLYGIS